MMLSTIRHARTFARPAVMFSTLATKEQTAADAMKSSCYEDIEFFVCEEDPVFDAVERFHKHGIGCLITKDPQGNMKGLISERDYITKIALLGRKSKDTQIKQIATPASKLVTAYLSDSVETCMQKMITKDIRHLPLLDEKDEVVGMISIKDLIKSAVKEKDDTIDHLKKFALGDDA